MPSNFTHPIVGILLGKTCATWLRRPMPRRFWLLSALLPMVPDADVIGFKLGIRYEDMLGHRGFSHSFLFALILSLLAVKVVFPRLRWRTTEWWGWLAFFFVLTASHTVLDAMTSGGLGVAFFAPFDNTRYFLPWRPIRVSPFGIRQFLSARGVRVITSELLWVWTPLLALYGLARHWRKRGRGAAVSHEGSRRV